MPKRPDSHRLETEHRLAFEKLVHAAGWVYQTVQPDYGLDGRVEVFDEDRTTGVMFLIQLKATAQKPTARELSVRLKPQTCAYYQSLDLPVLIVRYLARTGDVYARWFHEFDLSKVRTDAKSLTLCLSSEDLWTTSTAQELLSELETRRELRSPALRRPIRIKIEMESDQWRGHSAGSIALAIRKQAEPLNDLLHVALSAAEPPTVRIRIEWKQVTIWLGTEKSIAVHILDRYATSNLLEQFACDALLCIAYLLGSYGHREVATRILKVSLKGSGLKRDTEIFAVLVLSLASSGCIDEAFDLLTDRLEQEGSDFGFLSILGLQMEHAKMLRPQEKVRLIDFFRRIIDKTSNISPLELARGHYNLGNLLRGQGDRAALHHYRAAAIADPVYIDRSYWWREVGGILFINRRYSLSAKFYGRAVEMGETGEHMALWADALLFSGRYKAAEDAFLFYLRCCTDPEAEWMLKAWMLPWIQDFTGIVEQARRPSEAIRTASHILSDTSGGVADPLDTALSADALCGPAWFGLGLRSSANGNDATACRCYVAAALSAPSDVRLWCLATLSALGAVDECADMAQYILQTAYRFHGEALLDDVRGLLVALEDRTAANHLLDLLNQFTEARKQCQSPFEVRFLGSAGEVSIYRRLPGSEWGEPSYFTAQETLITSLP